MTKEELEFNFKPIHITLPNFNSLVTLLSKVTGDDYSKVMALFSTNNSDNVYDIISEITKHVVDINDMMVNLKGLVVSDVLSDSVEVATNLTSIFRKGEFAIKGDVYVVPIVKRDAKKVNVTDYAFDFENKTKRDIKLIPGCYYYDLLNIEYLGRKDVRIDSYCDNEQLSNELKTYIDIFESVIKVKGTNNSNSADDVKHSNIFNAFLEANSFDYSTHA